MSGLYEPQISRITANSPESDLEAAADLLASYAREHWSRRSQHYDLINRWAHSKIATTKDAYLAQTDRHPIGILLGQPDPIAGLFSLDLIYTYPDHRREGLGRKLIDVAFRDARARGMRTGQATVPFGNEVGKSFFESKGGRIKRLKDDIAYFSFDLDPYV